MREAPGKGKNGDTPGGEESRWSRKSRRPQGAARHRDAKGKGRSRREAGRRPQEGEGGERLGGTGRRPGVPEGDADTGGTRDRARDTGGATPPSVPGTGGSGRRWGKCRGPALPGGALRGLRHPSPGSEAVLPTLFSAKAERPEKRALARAAAGSATRPAPARGAGPPVVGREPLRRPQTRQRAATGGSQGPAHPAASPRQPAGRAPAAATPGEGTRRRTRRLPPAASPGGGRRH